ncbi:hypothetical protein Tco_0748700 [Tanacetum coccineum]|uniref:Uncharacterized protein n=1 Tax=Tanacetum coccineum TaxID=301880 RepID=A0ABQ4YWB8_9ASTR
MGMGNWRGRRVGWWVEPDRGGSNEGGSGGVAVSGRTEGRGTQERAEEGLGEGRRRKKAGSRAVQREKKRFSGGLGVLRSWRGRGVEVCGCSGFVGRTEGSTVEGQAVITERGSREAGESEEEVRESGGLEEAGECLSESGAGGDEEGGEVRGTGKERALSREVVELVFVSPKRYGALEERGRQVSAVKASKGWDAKKRKQFERVERGMTKRFKPEKIGEGAANKATVLKDKYASVVMAHNEGVSDLGESGIGYHTGYGGGIVKWRHSWLQTWDGTARRGVKDVDVLKKLLC